MTSDRPEVMKAFNVTLQHLLHRALRPGIVVSTSGIIEQTTLRAAKLLVARAKQNEVKLEDIYPVCKLLEAGGYYSLPVPPEEDAGSWNCEVNELLDALWRWCHFEPDAADQDAMKTRGTGPLATGEVQ